MGIGKGEEIIRLKKKISDMRIGILAEDFSKIHDLIKLGKERGIRIRLVKEAEDVDLDCLLVDDEKKVTPGPMNARSVLRMLKDPEASIERCIVASMDRFRPERLLAGIDPGKTPGMAFLADGRLVSIYKATSCRMTISRLKLMERACLPSSILVRLGDGAPSSRDCIRKLLEDAAYELEIVDERRTSTSRKFRDEVAAISIAHTRGERVNPEYLL